jgi:lipopolysaccharide transport system ATP-binding protein
MQSIIRAAGVGKQYRIGSQGAAYSTLRESVISAARAPLTALRRTARNREETFWALRDITLDVELGEVVGIIGRNGAGKSTLLKILSRITEPTTGRIELFGRVGSLLEVGTGFHPELTGRENIYLNGSILGMSRAEIDRKFDEIVAFAEIEKFLDTPVKRYSSGMYVRLAFAVAAHLEPEILVVDEVLAVGDVAFQKKCLGKMQAIASTGRTVLFVSHNMGAVQSLCTRGILLENGKIVRDAGVQSVVAHYLDTGMRQGGERAWDQPAVAPGDDVAKLRAVRARDASGVVRGEFRITQSFTIEVEFWVLQPGHQLDVGLYIYNEAGSLLFITGDFQDTHWNGRQRPIGIHRSVCTIPADFLNDGIISVLAAVATNPHTLHAIERDAIAIRLIDDYKSGGSRGSYTREWPGGLVRPRMQWSFDFVPPSNERAQKASDISR